MTSVTELAIDRTCRHEPGEPHDASAAAGLMRKLDNLRPHQNRALSSLRQSLKQVTAGPWCKRPLRRKDRACGSDG